MIAYLRANPRYLAVMPFVAPIWLVVFASWFVCAPLLYLFAWVDKGAWDVPGPLDLAGVLLPWTWE